MESVSSWPSSLRRKRNGSFQSTPRMKLNKLLIKEVLPGAPTNRIVLFSLILSNGRDWSFSSKFPTSKTKRFKVAGPISLLDLVNGTAYKPISSKYPILWLSSISILANRMSLTSTLADFKSSLLGICLSVDTRFGSEGPAAESSASTFQSSVRRLLGPLRWGEWELASISWGTVTIEID